jgi:hypothetical protein
MEQVEGGDLVVNRGNESKPKEGSDKQRDLNPVEGFEAAVKLSQANIEEVIKWSDKSRAKLKAQTTKSSAAAAAATTTSSSLTTPMTYSHVYLRIQPFFTTYHIPPPSPTESTSSSPVPASSNQQLSFLLYLSDPEHQLIQTAVTQSVPSQWLAIWDQHDWVEDSIAEVLRLGVEVIGQEYIVARMGWAGKEKELKEKIKEELKEKEKVGEAEDEDEDEDDEDEDDEEEEEDDEKLPRP